jgi:polyketide cyclase/dehydrase/lipid transport protein
MSTWTTSHIVNAPPEDVLAVLTDADAATRWAPVPFEVDDLAQGRLTTGSRAKVSGKLAGVRVGFDLEVHAADEDGLSLTANGPVNFDVLYDLVPHDDGSEVHASVSVRKGGGLTGRMLAQATDALLSAGALKAAVGRIARQAESVCVPVAA